MKGLVAVAIAALALTGAPVWAAQDCAVLCDGAYYTSATADDVHQLIQDGADVNARDSVGKSPLHWVAGAAPEVIVVLLQEGADVNAKDTLDRTPLHFVSAVGSGKNIALLLNAGADVNAKTANDWTPLHGAAKFGPPENIVILISAGADVSAKNEMGERPFDLAGTNQKLAGTGALELLKDAP